MRAYNHSWQINKWEYKEVSTPLNVIDEFLHLLRGGVEYRMPLKFIVLYVPLNKYYIRMDKVNKYLERVC